MRTVTDLQGAAMLSAATHCPRLLALAVATIKARTDLSAEVQSDAIAAVAGCIPPAYLSGDRTADSDALRIARGAARTAIDRAAVDNYRAASRAVSLDLLAEREAATGAPVTFAESEGRLTANGAPADKRYEPTATDRLDSLLSVAARGDKSTARLLSAARSAFLATLSEPPRPGPAPLFSTVAQRRAGRRADQGTGAREAAQICAAVAAVAPLRSLILSDPVTVTTAPAHTLPLSRRTVTRTAPVVTERRALSLPAEPLSDPEREARNIVTGGDRRAAAHARRVARWEARGVPSPLMPSPAEPVSDDARRLAARDLSGEHWTATVTSGGAPIVSSHGAMTPDAVAARIVADRARAAAHSPQWAGRADRAMPSPVAERVADLLSAERERERAERQAIRDRADALSTERGQSGRSSLIVCRNALTGMVTVKGSDGATVLTLPLSDWTPEREARTLATLSEPEAPLTPRAGLVADDLRDAERESLRIAMGAPRKSSGRKSARKGTTGPTVPATPVRVRLPRIAERD